MGFIKNALSPARGVLGTLVLGANSLVPGADGAGWLDRRPLSADGNPVLTAGDVTDYGTVSFVADPFLHVVGDEWHLFFEIQNGRRTPTAVIGHAKSSDAGGSWSYDGVVLEHDRHLAFPYVFEADGTVYMVPGQGGDPAGRPVTLFRANGFPHEWEPVVNLVDPEYGPLDPVVFRHDGRWWTVVGAGDNDTLYAYFADELESTDWTPHPENPVVTDRVRAGRPAGRPLRTGGGLVLFLQDSHDQYGDRVRAYRVTELTPTTYRDEPVDDDAMLAGRGGPGWNGGRMHHVDARYVGPEHGWIAVVDGDVEIGRALAGSCWSIGLYDLPGPPTVRAGTDDGDATIVQD